MAISGHARGVFESRAKLGNDELISPFNAAVAQILLDELTNDTAFGRRINAWPDTAQSDALDLRAIGGLHALKISNKAPYLAGVYPPNGLDKAALKCAVLRTIDAHDAFLCAFLDSPPQTNEVGRSSILLGAALRISAQFGLPIDLFEIGASAGLNLNFSEYQYDLGEGRVWGNNTNPVRIKSEWRGKTPDLSTNIDIQTCRGCDQNPLSSANAADRLHLNAYVWPDQMERVERVSSALSFAAGQPLEIDAADAANWVAQQLANAPQAGSTRVFYHTIVWQYLDAPTKLRITQSMEQAGATATQNTPLVWLRFEADGEPNGGRVEMTCWPSGETFQLGRADYHGRWVEWA